MIVTFDHNCIIALEQHEPEAWLLQTLATLCREHRVTLAVDVWMDLENLERGTECSNHPDLKVRLQAIGLDHAATMDRKPFCYMDHGILVFDPRFDQWMLQHIHAILFPNISFDLQEYIVKICNERNITPSAVDRATRDELERRWNNAKSDSLALSAALSWGTGIFVTNDRNFHKKSRQEALYRIAPHFRILQPNQALVELREYIIAQTHGEQEDIRAA